jgi:BirA family biotin operon repressor/biotin-[acetyl-CoA-carboxylase] ligase
VSLGEPREHHETIGSTNDRARELAEQGAAHGTLVTADEQTSGRGRQGRAWATPRGTAIAASLVLREFDELLPLRAGLAVADVAGPNALVKWPNDVWIDGRKVAGILAESRSEPRWAVLGIGVNVAVDVDRLPEDARAVAGSLNRDDVEQTLSELLQALARRLNEDRSASLAALRERDALRGRPVRWQDGEGTGAGIDDSGALLVTLPNGGQTSLSAGEVTLSARGGRSAPGHGRSGPFRGAA